MDEQNKSSGEKNREFRDEMKTFNRQLAELRAAQQRARVDQGTGRDAASATPPASMSAPAEGTVRQNQNKETDQ